MRCLWIGRFVSLATLILGLVACGSSGPVATPRPGFATPEPPPVIDVNAPWELVFSDEFNKDGPPNPAKWDPEEGQIRNNEAQYYTRDRLENARVADGHLVIEARKEEYNGAQYTSASLSTRNLKEFIYAKVTFTFDNEGTGVAAWPFDADMYLLINLAIGGSWGGQQGIDDSLFPHRCLIDYVRVYQKPVVG